MEDTLGRGGEGVTPAAYPPHSVLVLTGVTSPKCELDPTTEGGSIECRPYSTYCREAATNRRGAHAMVGVRCAIARCAVVRCAVVRCAE